MFHLTYIITAYVKVDFNGLQAQFTGKSYGWAPFAVVVQRNVFVKRNGTVRRRTLIPVLLYPTNCLPFRQLPVISTTIAQRVAIFKRELWFNCSHKIVLYRGKWSGKLRYYYHVTNIIWDFQLSGSHPYINMIYNFNFHFFSSGAYRPPGGGTVIFKEDKLLTFCYPWHCHANDEPSN